MQRLSESLPTMGVDISTVVTTKRPNFCSRCGEDHGRDCWICVRCERDYRAELVAEHVARLHKSIPPTFQDASFFLLSSSLGKRVTPWSKVSDCRTTSARTILLMGPAGAGKTTLAVAKLVQLAAEYHGLCLFVDAYELARARQTHPLGEGEAPLVARVMRARTVVLDDVGAERQDVAGTVGEVIFDRHAAERRTIVTTGMTEAQLRDRYGAGVHRRLFEDAAVIKLGDTGAEPDEGRKGAANG